MMDKKLEDLQSKLEEAKLGGGTARIEKQHEKGKLTARERIHFLNGSQVLFRKLANWWYIVPMILEWKNNESSGME